MTSFEEILPTANKILEEYYLCDHCLGRLFSKQLALTSNRLLGKRLRKDSESAKSCHICRNLYCDLKPLLELMLENSSGYDFETFMLGTQIKPSIVDRDDFIRSKFKLMGTDGVKTDITRQLSKQFSRKTGKTLDVLVPDLTFTINIKDRLCQIRTKPIILQANYTKTKRGFPQKQKPCSNCSGKGCQTCSFHGISEFESVEGKISEMLFARFGCTTVKFTWIGGEDRSSLVLGTGRPFFAKIQNPSKRCPRLARKIQLGFVDLYRCKILERFPRMPIKFFSTIKIRISAEANICTSDLRKLKPVLRHPVAVYEISGKRSEKSISRARYKRLSGSDFVLTVDAEGGLPVRRFVEGDDVSPGIGEILGVGCKCVRFDFMKVYQ